MGGGFVDVVVEGDHEVQQWQRAFQPIRTWRAQHGIGSHCHQPADLSFTWRIDLLGEAGGWEQAEDCRRSLHPACSGHQWRISRIRRRQIEMWRHLCTKHEAAGFSHIARQGSTEDQTSELKQLMRISYVVFY